MDYDVIVIGAGIAGASAGYFLAEQHRRRVLLLEAEAAPGYHTTGRSAAVFAPSYGNAVVRALTRASAGFFHAPPPGFSSAALRAPPRGAVWVARAEQLPALDRLEREVGGSAALKRETAAFARARIPVLRAGYVAECLWDAEVAGLDVEALLQGFLRGVRARGGQLYCHARVSALERSGSVWTVSWGGGQQAHAPWVINAAGAWADQIAELAGVRRIGLQPKRRTAGLLPAPPGLELGHWPLLMDAEESFYFKADAGRILLSPADETDCAPCDAYPEELEMALAVERFEAATTITVPRITHSWAGLRSFVPDRTPVLGLDPELPGFLWAAAQGGYGIQTAPAAGRCVANLIERGELGAEAEAAGIEAAMLSPARLRSGAV